MWGGRPRAAACPITARTETARKRVVLQANFQQRRCAEVPGWKSGSRYYVHSAFAADLAAADDFAHAGDANRLAWSDLLPAETRWPWRKTFFYLEVPDNEGER